MKLLEQVAAACRTMNYAPTTEKCYTAWVVDYSPGIGRKYLPGLIRLNLRIRLGWGVVVDDKNQATV